jgi:hypothetical protein
MGRYRYLGKTGGQRTKLARSLSPTPNPTRAAGRVGRTDRAGGLAALKLADTIALYLIWPLLEPWWKRRLKKSEL